MLRTTGTPSSVPTFLSTPSLRASLNPTLEFVNVESAEPKLTVTPPTLNNSPLKPMRAPGAIAVTSATVSICADNPYARAPVGPTQTATGIAADEIFSKTFAMRSGETTAPRELTCNTIACAPLVVDLSIAVSISATTTSSSKPLTATMSTGASCSADGVDSADAPAFIENPAAPMISATAPTRTVFENFSN